MSTPEAAGAVAHPVAAPAAAAGTQGVQVMQVDATWGSFTGVQGGLLLGAAVDAACATTGRHARSVQAVLLQRVDPGQVTLTSDVLRKGRGTSAVTVQAHTARGLALTANVLVSADTTVPPARCSQGEHDGGTRLGTEDAGEHAQLFGRPPTATEESLLAAQFVPFAQFLEYRPVGATYPMAGGTDPMLAAWIRLRDDGRVPRTPATVAAVLLDALPPSVMATMTVPVFAATADMSLHLTGPGLQVGQWARLVQRARWTDEHTTVDDAELRDRDGQLVAVSRQTRRMLSG